MRHRLACLLVLGWACVSAHAATAEARYPAHPVKVICGFPAGSSLDITTRIFAHALEETFGQPFIVENHVGASGNIGAELGSRSAPDGYTLMTNGTSQAISMSVFKDLKFDIVDDFEAVALISLAPNVLVVNVSLGANSVSELVARAKARPGELTFGASGVGTVPYLSGQLFNLMAGVKLTPVNYRGTNDALVDLIAGRLSLMFAPAPTLTGYQQYKQLETLAVTSAKPSKLFPALPTIAQSGLDGFDTSIWNGLWAPKGTPSEIVHVLNAAVVKASGRPAVQKALADSGAEPMFATPEEFDAFLRKDVKKWAEVVAFSGPK